MMLLASPASRRSKRMYTQIDSKVGLWLRQLGSCPKDFTGSPGQQIFALESRIAIQQWSLAPDTKIGAASLPKTNF